MFFLPRIKRILKFKRTDFDMYKNLNNNLVYFDIDIF